MFYSRASILSMGTCRTKLFFCLILLCIYSKATALLMIDMPFWRTRPHLFRLLELCRTFQDSASNSLSSRMISTFLMWRLLQSMIELYFLFQWNSATESIIQWLSPCYTWTYRIVCKGFPFILLFTLFFPEVLINSSCKPIVKKECQPLYTWILHFLHQEGR